MAAPRRRARRWMVLWGFLAGPALSAQVATETDYDLRWGSAIRDECRDCDRMPIERTLAGTFRLRVVHFGDVIMQYEVLDLNVSSPEGDYAVKGAGSYDTFYGDPFTQQMSLDLELNGVEGLKLSLDLGPSTGPMLMSWPWIDAVVTEPGDRDPFQVITMRLVAARTTRMVRYELQKGSIFIEDCTICGRPTIPVPIEGSFLLGEIEAPPYPLPTYRIDDVDFRSAAPEPPYRIVGAGYYRQGGEVALLQEMRLEIQVNDVSGNVLETWEPGVPVEYPEIDAELRQTNAPGIIEYSLHIIAGPAGEPPQTPFLRGDANADGAIDISDAVRVLLWLFLAQGPPTCLAAADSDDNGDHDVTDAVFTLGYLFQGGDPPPAPGPATCGTVPDPSLDCEAFPPCAP